DHVPLCGGIQMIFPDFSFDLLQNSWVLQNHPLRFKDLKITRAQRISQTVQAAVELVGGSVECGVKPRNFRCDIGIRLRFVCRNSRWYRRKKEGTTDRNSARHSEYPGFH